MNKFLGGLLISLPFVILFWLLVVASDWIDALMAFAVPGILFGCVAFGLHLIDKSR